jgi:DNA-binding phage protein
MKIGIAIAHIARSKKITQTSIAKSCGISRVCLHRFFTGKTEVKATTFLNILEVLGLEFRKQIHHEIVSQYNLSLKREAEIEAAEVLVNL